MEQVYHILLQHTSAVQPVSVDEAFLDVTALGDATGIAEAIRGAIEDSTGCTASAGIASNMLLARLATKRAKPNGVFRLMTAQASWASLMCSCLLLITQAPLANRHLGCWCFDSGLTCLHCRWTPTCWPYRWESCQAWAGPCSASWAS